MYTQWLWEDCVYTEWWEDCVTVHTLVGGLCDCTHSTGGRTVCTHTGGRTVCTHTGRRTVCTHTGGRTV